MFEVGFSEMLLIAVLALVVLGPERLPRVAAQMGRWVGRARAMARQFREQLEEEATLEATTRRPAASASGTHTGDSSYSAPGTYAGGDSTVDAQTGDFSGSSSSASAHTSDLSNGSTSASTWDS